MIPPTEKLLALLPSVDAVLGDRRLADLTAEPRPLRRRWVRQALDTLREEVRAGLWAPEDRADALGRAIDLARGCSASQSAPILKRVWNATGILLHTNLGRAVLPIEARHALLQTASGYSSLEFDLETGKRSSRLAAIRELIPLVTGAEAGIAVNNNAAAVFLTMAALAAGREVLVSRGELVEIGGSFRLPDILEASGVRLSEVGTTNRTRVSDYEKARTSETALVLHVHRSNFRLQGYSEDPELKDLAAFCRRESLPLIADIGSGALRDHAELFPDEPVVEDALADGADIVCFSTDKLLGIGQAGIIAGRRDLVEEKISRHPVARIVRLDKTLLTVLEVGLRIHLQGRETARREIPLLRALSRSQSDVAEAVLRCARVLGERCGDLEISSVEVSGEVGGGTLPGLTIHSQAISVRHPEWSVDRLANTLRKGEVPIVGRIQEDRLLLDLRAIEPEEEAAFIDAVAEAVTRGSSC